MTINGWKAKVLIIVLVVASFFVGVLTAKAQDADPLLKDVRYYQQVGATLQQEQRANDLEIQIYKSRIEQLENRQAIIKQNLVTLDTKIKELEAAQTEIDTETPREN